MRLILPRRHSGERSGIRGRASPGGRDSTGTHAGEAEGEESRNDDAYRDEWQHLTVLGAACGWPQRHE